jgi:hypothetical protein
MLASNILTASSLVLDSVISTSLRSMSDCRSWKASALSSMLVPCSSSARVALSRSALASSSYSKVSERCIPGNIDRDQRPVSSVILAASAPVEGVSPILQSPLGFVFCRPDSLELSYPFPK